MASSSQQSPRFLRNVPKPQRGVCERCMEMDATHYFSMFFTPESSYAGDPVHSRGGEILHVRVCARCKKAMQRLQPKRRKFKRF